MNTFKDRARAQVRAATRRDPYDASLAVRDLMSTVKNEGLAINRSITQAAANEIHRYVQEIMGSAKIELTRIAKRSGVAVADVESSFMQELKDIIY